MTWRSDSFVAVSSLQLHYVVLLAVEQGPWATVIHVVLKKLLCILHMRPHHNPTGWSAYSGHSLLSYSVLLVGLSISLNAATHLASIDPLHP